VPDVRVGLRVGAQSVAIGMQGTGMGLANGTTVVELHAERGATVEPDGRALVLRAPGTEGRYERIVFVSRTRDAFVTVDNRPYRGVVEVFARDGGVSVVNELSLEDYVSGVVNAELGRREQREQAAAEAQAIAARTYALVNRGKFAADGFDLRAGVVDQAYGGVTVETGLGMRAVRSTRGMVLTYAGEPITPFYHSTCGGSTAAPEEAFRSAATTSYLRPVSDRDGDGYYCDVSPRFAWSVEWDVSELRDIFREKVPSVLGIAGERVDVVRDVRVQRTGASGRVTELRLVVEAGEIPVYAADVRAVLAPERDAWLGSNQFRLAVERSGGVPTRVRADGFGWGHGVGMCQWGAIGRARAGQDARTILTTYFPGTRLERWY
jgi:stage II sporulation protein D